MIDEQLGNLSGVRVGLNGDHVSGHTSPKLGVIHLVMHLTF
jgi:hypothetical protein